MLWLGVAGVVTDATGTSTALDPVSVAAAGRTVTLQNRISDLVMPPPVPVNSSTTPANSVPGAFLAVQSVRLERPVYLQRMSETLIFLIAVSAVLAVFTRGFNDLLLGVGGLILDVWGVRSVLLPSPCRRSPPSIWHCRG